MAEQASGLVKFGAPVVAGYARPDCDPASPGCHPTYITPNADGFFSLAGGRVVLAGWNQGLTFCSSEDYGQTWRRLSVQPGPGGAGWAAGVGSIGPAVRFPGGITGNIGLLPTGCNATGHDARLAAECPQFGCSAVESPAPANFTPDLSAPGGFRVAAACRRVAVTGLLHPLVPALGLTDDFTFPAGPVALPDGSFFMTYALSFADGVVRNTSGVHGRYPMNLVGFGAPTAWPGGTSRPWSTAPPSFRGRGSAPTSTTFRCWPTVKRCSL